MDKKKEIEHVRNIVSRAMEICISEQASDMAGYIVSAFFAAGYRKQSDTVKKFAEQLTRIVYHFANGNEGVINLWEFITILNEVAEQFGKEEV